MRATLQAFRENFPSERLVVLFQPHRFSRTVSRLHEFTTCFTQADQLILTDIYAAGEAPIAGITSQALVTEIKQSQTQYLPKATELAQQVRLQLKPGELLRSHWCGRRLEGWHGSSGASQEVMNLIQQHQSLKQYNSWWVCGEAQYFCLPQNLDELLQRLCCLRLKNTKSPCWAVAATRSIPIRASLA